MVKESIKIVLEQYQKIGIPNNIQDEEPIKRPIVISKSHSYVPLLSTLLILFVHIYLGKGEFDNLILKDVQNIGIDIYLVSALCTCWGLRGTDLG